MNKREIASLAFKIAGLYAIVQAIKQSGSILLLLGALLRACDLGLETPEDLWRFLLDLAVVILPCALLTVLGILLLARSSKLAGWVFDAGDPALAQPTDPHELQAIAFSVLGVFVVAMAVPSLGAVLMNASVRDLPEHLRPRVWTPLIKLGLQSGIGLGLFFGARPLARFWHKMRTGGIVHADHGAREAASDEEAGV